MDLHASSTAAPEYIFMSGIPDLMVEQTRRAIELTSLFLGSVSSVGVVFLRPQQASSAYDTVAIQYCRMVPETGCFNSQPLWRQSAIDGTPPLWSVFGRTRCSSACSQSVLEFQAIEIMPPAEDYDMIAQAQLHYLPGIVAHEYAHIFQGWATGDGLLPVWLIEGGAVQLQCLMAQALAADLGYTRLSSREDVSYSDCFQYGGGRQSVVDQALIAVRDHGSDALRLHEASQNSITTDLGAVFYDLGAVAIAFAIHHANSHFASDGGRTSAHFWTSPSKGFWHRIGKVSISSGDLTTNEGEGWRRALCDFTGFATMSAFYDAFRDTMNSASAGAGLHTCTRTTYCLLPITACFLIPNSYRNAHGAAGERCRDLPDNTGGVSAQRSQPTGVECPSPMPHHA